MSIMEPDPPLAFPTHAQTGNCENGKHGMSLRDYFAAAALAGVIAAEAHPQAQGAVPVDENTARFIAVNVWRYADAMLKERGQ